MLAPAEVIAPYLLIHFFRPERGGAFDRSGEFRVRKPLHCDLADFYSKLLL